MFSHVKTFAKHNKHARSFREPQCGFVQVCNSEQSHHGTRFCPRGHALISTVSLAYKETANATHTTHTHSHKRSQRCLFTLIICWVMYDALKPSAYIKDVYSNSCTVGEMRTVVRQRRKAESSFNRSGVCDQNCLAVKCVMVTVVRKSFHTPCRLVILVTK